MADLINVASQAASGNYVGAAASLLSGLLSGHSPWYKADQQLAAGNWSGFRDYMVSFYNRGGVTDADFAGGIDGDLYAPAKGKKVPRYTMLPTLVTKTNNDPAVVQMYKATVAAGLIPDTLNLNTVASTISNIFGGSQNTNSGTAAPSFLSKYWWVLFIPVAPLLWLVFRKK